MIPGCTTALPEKAHHILLSAQVANILATCYGLVPPPSSKANWVPADSPQRDVAHVLHLCQNVAVSDWVPSSDGPALSEDDIKAHEAKQEAALTIEQASARFAAVLQHAATLADHTQTLTLQLCPASFEKDCDANFHIDFIAASTNLRAWNYRLDLTTREQAKVIAGRIIPAILTATAAVTGLMCAELCKLVQGRGIDSFRDSSNNLAVNQFSFFTPNPAAVTKHPSVEDQKAAKARDQSALEKELARPLPSQDVFRLLSLKSRVDAPVIAPASFPLRGFTKWDKIKLAEADTGTLSGTLQAVLRGLQPCAEELHVQSLQFGGVTLYDRRRSELFQVAYPGLARVLTDRTAHMYQRWLACHEKQRHEAGLGFVDANAAAKISASTANRIRRELDRMSGDAAPRGLSLHCLGGDLTHCEASVVGPEGTAYAGGLFRLSYVFPQDYPFLPPKVTFKAPVYHCNIDESGVLCGIPALKDQWAPGLQAEQILAFVAGLLASPNPDSYMVQAIAQLFTADKVAHDAKAAEWTRVYAQPEVTAEQQLAVLAAAASLQQADSSGKLEHQSKRSELGLRAMLEAAGVVFAPNGRLKVPLEAEIVRSGPLGSRVETPSLVFCADVPSASPFSPAAGRTSSSGAWASLDVSGLRTPDGSALVPETLYSLPEERAALYRAVCADLDGAEAVGAVCDGVEWVLAVQDGKKAHAVFADDAISCDLLSPSQLLEYCFSIDGPWYLSSIGDESAALYRSSKFEQWLRLLKNSATECLATFIRVLKGGVITRLFDADIFPSPPEEAKQWVTINAKGIPVKVPRPVAGLRIWDAASGGYREVKSYLEGAPGPVQADIDSFLEQTLRELKSATRNHIEDWNQFIHDAMTMPLDYCQAKYVTGV